ncbi:MAG: hypothetical protein ACREEN_03130 [Stellaceae bacterium]
MPNAFKGWPPASEFSPPGSACVSSHHGLAGRWLPWRQGLEYDAGLFFICYQRDPRTGFIKIVERMAKFDMMNQFVTHVGGGLFACQSGATEGEFIGQRLFEKA